MIIPAVYTSTVVYRAVFRGRQSRTCNPVRNKLLANVRDAGPEAVQARTHLLNAVTKAAN